MQDTEYVQVFMSTEGRYGSTNWLIVLKRWPELRLLTSTRCCIRIYIALPQQSSGHRLSVAQHLEDAIHQLLDKSTRTLWHLFNLTRWRIWSVGCCTGVICFTCSTQWSFGGCSHWKKNTKKIDRTTVSRTESFCEIHSSLMSSTSFIVILAAMSGDTLIKYYELLQWCVHPFNMIALCPSIETAHTW